MSGNFHEMRGHILNVRICYFAVDVPTWYTPSFTR